MKTLPSADLPMKSRGGGEGKRIIILLASSVMLIVALGTCGHFYNYYFFPLGRLARDINQGDAYESVRERFETYYRTYRKQRPVQFSEFGLEARFEVGFRNNESKGLHLYDVSEFDDVQLTVLFDGDGRVSRKLFLGD